MTANFNQLTPEQTEALSILAEECAEVVQAATKILRHGLDSHHPTMGAWDNRTQLEVEVGQVLASVFLTSKMGILRVPELKAAKAAKIFTLRRWTHHIDWSKIDG